MQYNNINGNNIHHNAFKQQHPTIMAEFNDKFNFPHEELKILEFWKRVEIFENIQAARKRSYEAGKSKIYSFYDGPPFATGLPHYGHIVTGTIKDIVSRFATQNNCYVERRFGWDCHGLPVEYEIDKRLDIRSPADVQAMGIAAYNDECRGIVMRYAAEWQQLVTRMGRWVDFANDYKTMYWWFMESVWWVFGQIYSKGLVYKGTKVMPYSVGCQTPLSNFEAGQNYKEVFDVAITVALDLISDGNAGDSLSDKLLIWTTTPWTLPCNFAVCVNPNFDYVRIKDETNGKVYVLAKCRIELIFPDYLKTEKYAILKEFKGSELKDRKYKPPFHYYDEEGAAANAFRVLLDEYVTKDVGTGIVHQAPYFGEDDYRVCLENGLITKSSRVICPLDANGRFTNEIHDFSGLFYKDANQLIIEKLTALEIVISMENVKHSMPFCWRSDTPLIYKSVSCWFMRVEHMVGDLLKNNAQTRWTPDIVKEKRFANWLSNARDWAISRNRYWGTPIPIWSSASGDEVVCITSLAELREKTGMCDISDLHRESIDHLVIPSAIPGNPPLRRVSEVFDCWFESGAMPYAQAHYPFENKEAFKATFPADFIAEGIDQTRGWFYTLLVLSTALFQEAPFRNVIVNGLVLAADGQKMSKRKKNYPDPLEVISRHGADAVRLYLINSPLVRAGNLNFKEEGVKNMLKNVMLPWYNALRFLVQNIESYAVMYLPGAQFYFNEFEDFWNFGEHDLLDVWLLSKNETFLQFITDEMLNYNLYAVTPKLIEHIDELTNWYVRLKRTHIKGDAGALECRRALVNLYYALLTLSKVMAAFMPYFSEYCYQQLAKYLPDAQEINSVHHCLIPKPKNLLINTKIEKVFRKFQKVVELGRKLRERQTLPLKYPIAEIVVIHASAVYLDDLKRWESELLKELNSRRLTLSTDRKRYGVSLRAEPNQKELGMRFKSESKSLAKAIRRLSDASVEKALLTNEIEILDHKINTSAELYVNYKVEENAMNIYEFAHDQEIMIGMDFSTTADMWTEGLTREIINRIQKLKKAAKLLPSDKVIVAYDLQYADDEYDNDDKDNKDDNDDVTTQNRQMKDVSMAEIILEQAETISRTIKSEFRSNFQPKVEDILIEQVVKIKNCILKLIICTEAKNLYTK